MRRPHWMLAGCATLLVFGIALGDARSDPSLGKARPAAGAEAQEAEAIIQKARQVSAAAQTMEAEVALNRLDSSTMEYKVQMMKPGFAHYRLREQNGVAWQVISDGKSVYVVDESNKEYRKLPYATTGREMLVPSASEVCGPLHAFFAPEQIGALGTPRSAGTKQVNGQTYQTVEFSTNNEQFRWTYYFGASGLLEGIEFIRIRDGRTETQSMWLKNVKVDVAMKREQFAFTPPADFKEMAEAN